jgi:hypothetical protein
MTVTERVDNPDDGYHYRLELDQGTAVEVDLTRFDPARPEAIVQVWGRLGTSHAAAPAQGAVAIAIPLDKIPSLTGALLAAHRMGKELRDKAARESEGKK